MSKPKILTAWSEPDNLDGLVAFCDVIAGAFGNRAIKKTQRGLRGTKQVEGLDGGITEISLSYSSNEHEFDFKIELSPWFKQFPDVSSLSSETPSDRSLKLTLQSFSQWARAVDPLYPHVLIGALGGSKPESLVMERVNGSGIFGFLDELTPVSAAFPRMLAPTPQLIPRLHGRFDTLHPVLFSGNDLASRVAQAGIGCGLGQSITLTKFPQIVVTQLRNDCHRQPELLTKCRELDLLI